MELREQEAKDKLEDIFQTDIRSCEYLKNFALKIEFAQKHDISQCFSEGQGLSEGEAKRVKYHNQNLYELSEKIPLMVFHNAVITKEANSEPSESSSYEYRLQQDPPHFDYWEGNSEKVSSFLYKDENISRLAPTHFILPKELKIVIPKMADLDLPTHVLDAMKNMSSKDYKFSLGDAEKQTRTTIMRSYANFTQEVFDRISEDSKYAQNWEKGSNIITLHHNDADKLLHARPASDDESNDVSLSDLYPV